MMTKIKLWLMSTIFAFITVAMFNSINRQSVLAIPSNKNSDKNILNKLIFFFHSEARKKQPKITRSGIRRTRVAGGRSCGLDLVALVPKYNGGNLGLTITDTPTFWFYLPPNSHSITSMKFKLLDFNGKEVWSTQLSPKLKINQSGLMRVNYQGHPLSEDTYRWEFSYQNTDCHEQVLSGNLQKEKYPNTLIKKSSREKIHFLAQHGIWHDLITELLTLRQQYPDDQQLTADFRTLIFESPDIKYMSLINSNTDDLELMEKIVNAQVIDHLLFTPSIK